MNKHLYRLTLLASVAALTTGLVACNKAEERTAGQQIDSAIAKTENAAERAGDQIKEGATQMQADASAAASRVADSAGDAAITASVSAGLLKDPDLSAIKIDVDTKDGVVSLNGPAPTSAAKERAETIAKSVSGVKEVRNNLEVKAS